MTVVDPRGVDRLGARVPRARNVWVQGRGWRPTDRMHVICSAGAPGSEVPVLWMDRPIGDAKTWSVPNAPPGRVEFRVVRDGAVAGRAVVAPGDEGGAFALDAE